MSADLKALSWRFFDEALNNGNLDVVDELLAPDAVNRDAALPEPTVGIEAAKASITSYREAFPDLRVSLEEQIAEGSLVVTRWTATGTHRGELFGLPATGKQATVSGISIDRYESGRVVESWTNWDTFGLMQQLGAIPAPATA